jgi:hypothetical protein
MHLGSKHSR